jgi:hypothetical protein
MAALLWLLLWPLLLEADWREDLVRSLMEKKRLKSVGTAGLVFVTRSCCGCC